ncbi:similar to stress responsive A/B barrel domain protein [Plenodomus lingam JN3]|uniref:Similar to stress responsive A/B barrel domain protein n=1 Tax=Leptosphaeria maculans (strain JN3 / isolate v23.1.3 / race Av1-4-5-6-7-8) TaxID=985895 RepID=E5A5Q9_LEPMJ|nr:similar to stress responsive A/B barrel domain protein [Plenodomus lingam JN3]CBX98957.1 similar to stress responsive A/B barrel domain protein [Plenodomus lingam JN3]
MPFYQMSFFKFKPDADPALIQEWLAISKTMPEKIPCVRSLVAGRPAGQFKHLAKGWDVAACIELDNAESPKEFQEHPEHVRPRELSAQICDRNETVSIMFEVE